MIRFFYIYKNEIVKKFMKEYHYTSVMRVPKINKIVISMGVGKAVSNKKLLDNAISDLTLITGQKPIITKSRKSIASFKVRQGYPIGCKVTLRGKMMWNFFEKFITIVVPRIRDFRGLSSKSFDGRGNYSIGIKEQIIFPEIDYSKIDCIRGMNITINTNARSDNESYALLNAFNFPFNRLK